MNPLLIAIRRKSWRSIIQEMNLYVWFGSIKAEPLKHHYQLPTKTEQVMGLKIQDSRSSTFSVFSNVVINSSLPPIWINWGRTKFSFLYFLMNLTLQVQYIPTQEWIPFFINQAPNPLEPLVQIHDLLLIAWYGLHLVSSLQKVQPPKTKYWWQINGG